MRPTAPEIVGRLRGGVVPRLSRRTVLVDELGDPSGRRFCELLKKLSQSLCEGRVAGAQLGAEECLT
jgi:hypothetical protein